MAAALTRLHIYPQAIDHFSFGEQLRNGLPRQGFLWSGSGGLHRDRHGLYVHRCRSFRSDDEGEVGEKKNISEKKCKVVKESEDKLKEGDGFWSTLKHAVSGFGRLDSQSNEEHTKAVAKLEEVLSSVSC